MEFNIISQKIKDKIEKADNILLVCHQQPDADAVGSVVALSDFFNSLDKSHVKFCKDPAPASLEWLANFENLETKISEVIKQNFDLIITVDSSDKSFCGLDELLQYLEAKPFVINIDHHATNDSYGDLNLVDVTAASTTEIIYRVFKNLKIKIPANTASALLAGIIGDTYSFTNTNTGQKSMEAASGLLVSGASLPQVSDSILKNKDIETLKLWGKVLLRLQYNPNFDMAVTVVTEEDFEASGLEVEAAEGISNFLNNLDSAKAVCVLAQHGEMVKGSLRTNDDLVDVSQIAKMLGGGGHKKAAGFKVKGRIVKDDAGHYQIV